MTTCNGDGACAAARLMREKARCAKCGGESFDHETDTPEQAFCLDCGEDKPAPGEGGGA